MAIEIRIGKLDLKKSLEQFINDFLKGYDCVLLPITLPHIYHTQLLPLHYRDPFDRLIIAQAIVENVEIISSDAAFDAYPIQRIW